MTYDVLNDNLYENDKKSKKKKGKKFKINPLYIHIIIILIILGGLFFYFIPINNNSSNVIGDLTLVGNLDSFNKSYVGNLNFYSKDFILETKDTFRGTSTNFYIKNFEGNIYLENKSIIFAGIADKISYDSNNINLGNSKFKLISKRKTTFNANFNELNLFVLNGNLKVDNSLSHDFINSSIKIKDINSTITYDGTFLISGVAKEFNFKSDAQKLNIEFVNE